MIRARFEPSQHRRRIGRYRENFNARTRRRKQRFEKKSLAFDERSSAFVQRVDEIARRKAPSRHL